MNDPEALRTLVAERAEALGESGSPFAPDDVEAVSTTLTKWIISTAEPPAVDTQTGRALLADSTRDLRGSSKALQRWRREALLVSALFTLAARHVVRLTGTVSLTGVPRRRIVDPLDPDMRLSCDFRTWQDAFAQRLGRSTSLAEIAWEAMTALLLWGGPCGDDAFRLIWALQRSDCDLRTGRLCFRRGGRVVLEWSAAPIQYLALGRLLRTHRTPSRWVFPRHLRTPAKVYLNWLQVVLPNPPELLRQVTTTLARWMVDIYPGWLVALAAGRFHVRHRDPAQTLPRGRRAKPYPPCPRERRLRADMRRCLLRWLPRRISSHARADFLRAWKRQREQSLLPHLMSRRVNAGEADRLKYLDRLVVLIQDLVQETTSGATVIQAWDLGCSILDQVGTDPEQTPEVVPTSLLRFRPATRRAFRQLLTRLAPAAGKAIPVWLFRGRSDPPSYIPDPDACEALRRMVPEVRHHSRDTVGLYLDLLRVGLRKDEALGVLAQAVDPDGYAEMWVEGTKTRSAKRRLPLDSHPDREAVTRIRALARDRREDSLGPLLRSSTGSFVARSRHPDRPQEVVIDSLDHGLQAASRAACLPGDVTPHALRHASISLCLERGIPLEGISRMHGHAELRTSLELYVHSAEHRQRALLAQALDCGFDVWLPLPWVARYLGVSRQAVYKRFRDYGPDVRAGTALPSSVLRRSWPRVTYYVAAGRVAAVLARGTRRGRRDSGYPT